MNAFELNLPRTLHEAVGLLDANDPTVRVISGGTALMLMMKSDVFRPSRLVSLRDIEKEYFSMGVMPDGHFRIGAMATLSQLQQEDTLCSFAPVIRHTMRVLSNVRVRNVATIGGALAHGDPHMDLPPVLVALNADVIAQGPDGERRVPIEQLHTGYYETVLSGNELIKEIIIPPQQGRKATYLKCTTRAAKDWPALGVAVSMDMADDTARDTRLVIGSVSDRPSRVPVAEAVLKDRALSPDIIRKAAEATADTVETVTDELGSAAYKKQLVRVYVERTLNAVASHKA